MTRRLNAMLIHDETVSAEVVQAHVSEDSGIRLSPIFSSLSPQADAVRQADTDVLLVACREGAQDALALLEWWQTMPGSRPALLLTHGAQADFLEEAFKAGADDVVVLHPGPYVPEQNQRDLEFAIRKAVARNLGAHERSSESGTLITVLGSKGGVGKTLAATNIGASLASRGYRTALVDLDLQFGDVALALAVAPDTTIFDLAVSGGSLDAEKLDDFMLRHSSGLRVLAAPARPDHAASVTAGIISNVYTLLRQDYEYVVVDTPPSFTAEVITTIDVASWVCMVGMLDALSVKNTRLGLETLNLMNFPPDRVRMALNRANTNVGLSQKDAVALLGRVPDVLIPSDREVTRSINQGVPVVLSSPRSELGRALTALADLFVEVPGAQHTPAEPQQIRIDGHGSRKRWRFSRRKSPEPVPGASSRS
ncbi:MAG: AAA family ATPase [Solirubrobacteraceae bacterium]